MATTSKVAILIDGGFFIQRYKSNNGGVGPRVTDLQPFTNTILTKIQALTGSHCTDTLFRIYYYDCRPYGGKEKDSTGKQIDFSQSKQFHAAQSFQKDLRTYPQLALRLGDLSFDGWKLDAKNPSNPPKPDFKQKSVDMKIGLDIAWMAGKRTVDKIVLVAGDSDFIAPMKFARKEGLLVYLDPMGQLKIKLELKEHADFIL